MTHYSKSHKSSSDRSAHAQLQQAIDYIHTHLDRDLSLVELASVVNVSPRSLFKHAMGISPHQYVIQQQSRTGKIDAEENRFGDRDIAWVGFQSKLFNATV